MKCDFDIRKVVRQCRAVTWHDHFPRNCGAHEEGIDRVGSIHDEIHGGCSRIHLVFPRYFPASIVFFFFVGKVLSRRQRVCCSAFASRHCVSTLHLDTLRTDCQQTGGGHKKWFQYCLNPNYPHRLLYLRAIHGHSGSTINPALQDNVLLPEGFTEQIYHVGNGKELRSIVNHGLIPGGVSLKTGRQAVFCTVVNPMDDGLGATLCDFSQARIAP